MKILFFENICKVKKNDIYLHISFEVLSEYTNKDK